MTGSNAQEQTQYANDEEVIDALTAMLETPDEGDAPKPKQTSLLDDEDEPAADEEQESEPEQEAEAEDEQAPEEADDTAESDESEEEADADDEEPEPEAKTYTVKVNGEEVEVTEDELLAGYSRTSDYTRKTQEIAALRKQLEPELESVRAEREQYARLLTRLEEQVGGNEQEPDWDALRRNDPYGFAEQWAAWQQKQQRRQAIQTEKQRLESIRQQEAAQQRAKILKQEDELLLSAVPEWKDQKVRQKETAELVQFARDLGFNDDELTNVTDHRAIVLMRDAAAYRRMMAKTKGKVAAPKASSKKTLKPGAPQAPRKKSALDDAKKRLARTGSVEDAASVLEKMLLGE